jgi:transcription initiation factor TFIIIB Brf1 subunit/transcription initiation factor TFIIB
MDRIEHTGSEWRSFDSVETRNRQRTGAPFSLARHDKGLYTQIGGVKDSSHEIDSYLYLSMRRLKNLDNRTHWIHPLEISRKLLVISISLDISWGYLKMLLRKLPTFIGKLMKKN